MEITVESLVGIVKDSLTDPDYAAVLDSALAILTIEREWQAAQLKYASGVMDFYRRQLDEKRTEQEEFSRLKGVEGGEPVYLLGQKRVDTMKAAEAELAELRRLFPQHEPHSLKDDVVYLLKQAQEFAAFKESYIRPEQLLSCQEAILDHLNVLLIGAGSPPNMTGFLMDYDVTELPQRLQKALQKTHTQEASDPQEAEKHKAEARLEALGEETFRKAAAVAIWNAMMEGQVSPE